MTAARELELKQNYLSVASEIPQDRRLICVSKTFPISDIEILYRLGHRDFGENKVQELAEKALALANSCPEIRWHMIGHLQSNKIKKLLSLPNLAAIHSIDSIELLNKLIKSQYDKSISIFLEVKTTSENEKAGFENLFDLKKAILILKDQNTFKLQGLMTIGSIRSHDFEKAALESFQKLMDLKRDLDQEFQLKPSLELSMGMSQDYRMALKMGSNYVRIGSKILGSRENT
jgi:pyridoxal phosphate enzyme (YggS family)